MTSDAFPLVKSGGRPSLSAGCPDVGFPGCPGVVETRNSADKGGGLEDMDDGPVDDKDSPPPGYGPADPRFICRADSITNSILSGPS